MASGSNYNPYQPPTFDEAPESGPTGQQATFATRGERFAAALLDGLIMLALLLPAQFAAGVFEGFPKNVQQQSLAMTAAWSLASITLYLLLHGYLLSKNAQTIGKRLLGIRIVNFSDGQKTPFAKILLWRVLPVQIVALIPVVGPFASLVDSLFIFRKDYRTIHDHVAGTIVVKVPK